jgi:FdrA protein
VKDLGIRAGFYRDSVRLMQISTTLAALPGVSRSLVAMATPLNLDLAEELGFERPAGAGPNDMLVALEATSEEALASAKARLDAELSAAGGAGTGGAAAAGAGTGAGAPPLDTSVAPRTTSTAVAAASANLVLVSTPGRYAFVEAMDALEAGASVMVFSDNVPIAQEVALKRRASELGLLVMGPDCGTAIVGGVGLGFANVVRPGRVGLVAASGTGAQQVLSLLAWAGVGVSHCLGVGGRDLTEPIGGLSTMAALKLLDADPATELIVLIGKPPAASVSSSVLAHLSRLSTPVVPAWSAPSAHDLTAATESVLERLEVAVPVWPTWVVPSVGSGGYLRGLFSGGTLCVEAVHLATAALGPVWSNVDTSADPPSAADDGGHRFLDLGDDEFTLGRPHPMIDFSLRLARLSAELADPSCGAVLLDVVLGHGAHPDPASELAPVLSSSTVPVVVALIGTRDDPQGLDHQAAALANAGASVLGSNAAAARHAISLVSVA